MSHIQQLTPHLMFQNGRAEEALQFYVQLFQGEILMLLHYEDDTQGVKGQVQHRWPADQHHGQFGTTSI